jgi:hypothetical protein
MDQSTSVAEALLGFYERFSTADPAQFAGAIAEGPGVLVIGSGPDEGHDDREDWIAAYRRASPRLGSSSATANPAGIRRAPLAWRSTSRASCCRTVRAFRPA